MPESVEIPAPVSTLSRLPASTRTASSRVLCCVVSTTPTSVTGASAPAHRSPVTSVRPTLAAPPEEAVMPEQAGTSDAGLVVVIRYEGYLGAAGALPLLRGWDATLS